GPRDAVQPMLACCKTFEIGLSALPAKSCCTLRSAASRMAESGILTGTTTKEVRDTGGSGGNLTIAGPATGAPGDSQSMIFRLMKNDPTITPSAIPTILSRCRCIVPPVDQADILPRGRHRRQCGDPDVPFRGAATSSKVRQSQSHTRVIICCAYNDLSARNRRGPFYFLRVGKRGTNLPTWSRIA